MVKINFFSIDPKKNRGMNKNIVNLKNYPQTNQYQYNKKHIFVSSNLIY